MYFLREEMVKVVKNNERGANNFPQRKNNNELWKNLLVCDDEAACSR